MAKTLRAWSNEADLPTILAALRKHWKLAVGFLGLEASAGLAATALVVLLGVTEPEWIDQPLGWLLLGLIGPTLAAATIAKVPIGGIQANIGLSLVYLPARHLLLDPLDRAVYRAARPRQVQLESIYRHRAVQALANGQRNLAEVMDELRAFGERPLRGEDDRELIREKLASVNGMLASGTSDDREAVSVLVAFMVGSGFIDVLARLFGQPTEEELQQVQRPVPPAGALTENPEQS